MVKGLCGEFVNPAEKVFNTVPPAQELTKGGCNPYNDSTGDEDSTALDIGTARGGVFLTPPLRIWKMRARDIFTGKEEKTRMKRHPNFVGLKKRRDEI